MNYFKQLKKMIVMAGFLGLLLACGEHAHEETMDGSTLDGENKKEHSHSHD